MIPRVYDSGRKRQWWVTVIHFLSACAVRLELPAAASASKGQAANSSDPGPAVIWKSEGVDDIPSHYKPRPAREGERAITWLRNASPHRVFGARAGSPRSAPCCFVVR